MTPPALQRSAFAFNLRWLCNSQPSIASVCRETGINRQQFNRYLAGSAIPSAQVMRSICAKFGVAEASMFLPHEELIQLMAMDRSADELTRMLGAMGARKPDRLKPGYYFRYEAAVDGIEPRLLRSLYRVHDSDGKYMFRATRRMIDADKQTRRLGRHRLTGTILKIAGYVYFFETRLPATDELSFAVFGNASERNNVRTGMVFHHKRAMRAALEYLGENVEIRKILKRCGYFAPDEPGIDENLRTMLLSDSDNLGVLEAAAISGS